MLARYTDPGLVPQGIGAEMIADKWGITREDLDAFGAESQRRAAQATDEGRFDNEIVGVKEKRLDKETGNIVESDELVTARRGHPPRHHRRDARQPEAGLQARRQDHRRQLVSQISDGASAALIMSEEKAKELGLTPRARFHTFALAGVDPVTMLTGPIPSTAKALEKAGMSIDDIDLFEINEAFASVVLAWEKELKADLGKTNVNGGAIALGHPLGGSGTKLLATLLNELERTGGRFGLQSMCEGGGLANATIIERLGLSRTASGGRLACRRCAGSGCSAPRWSSSCGVRRRRVAADPCRALLPLLVAARGGQPRLFKIGFAMLGGLAQPDARAAAGGGAAEGQDHLPLQHLRHRGADDHGQRPDARAAPALPRGHGPRHPCGRPVSSSTACPQAVDEAGEHHTRVTRPPDRRPDRTARQPAADPPILGERRLSGTAWR